MMQYRQHLGFLFAMALLIALCGSASCTQPKTPPLESPTTDASGNGPDVVSKDGAPVPLPCGNGTCPSAEYVCCQNNKDAPPECCLKGYNACYNGGGGLTGWPVYNGCNVQKCLGDRPKHCPGGSRGTCCKQNETCGESFGIAFCEDKSCPDDRKCNGGKICCSKPGICKPFKNIEFCDDTCSDEGKVKCSLTGTHYGDEQSFHVCCATGACRHHPDGWPFCDGEVY